MGRQWEVRAGGGKGAFRVGHSTAVGVGVAAAAVAAAAALATVARQHQPRPQLQLQQHRLIHGCHLQHRKRPALNPCHTRSRQAVKLF